MNMRCNEQDSNLNEATGARRRRIWAGASGARCGVLYRNGVHKMSIKCHKIPIKCGVFGKCIDTVCIRGRGVPLGRIWRAEYLFFFATAARRQRIWATALTQNNKVLGYRRSRFIKKAGEPMARPYRVLENGVGNFLWRCGHFRCFRRPLGEGDEVVASALRVEAGPGGGAGLGQDEIAPDMGGQTGGSVEKDEGRARRRAAGRDYLRFLRRLRRFLAV